MTCAVFFVFAGYQMCLHCPRANGTGRQWEVESKKPKWPSTWSRFLCTSLATHGFEAIWIGCPRFVRIRVRVLGFVAFAFAVLESVFASISILCSAISITFQVPPTSLLWLPPPTPLPPSCLLRQYFDVRPNRQSQCFDILTLIRPKCCVFSNQTDNNGSKLSRPCTQAQTFTQHVSVCDLECPELCACEWVGRRASKQDGGQLSHLAYFLHSTKLSHTLSPLTLPLSSGQSKPQKKKEYDE